MPAIPDLDLDQVPLAVKYDGWQVSLSRVGELPEREVKNTIQQGDKHGEG